MLNYRSRARWWLSGEAFLKSSTHLLMARNLILFLFQAHEFPEPPSRQFVGLTFLGAWALQTRQFGGSDQLTVIVAMTFKP